MAKDCDQPRNPDNVTCRNCEKQGHFSRDCTEPKDWSKVQCQNCQEFGHTIKVSTLSHARVQSLTFHSAARPLLPREMPWVQVALSRPLVIGEREATPPQRVEDGRTVVEVEAGRAQTHDYHDMTSNTATLSTSVMRMEDIASV